MHAFFLYFVLPEDFLEKIYHSIFLWLKLEFVEGCS
jgi:hypothetical protein